ncbi:hypothetical protein VaNZ11_004931 [Volvox africanus]|uniref:FHA domain-containing protein n=1 Tax=Volvox africanus TaxID=51714 RepID=A0ABQ5RY01_9CHLO|nr:hypothetical protein VaNZ11_004931 [Volvox africanus]
MSDTKRQRSDSRSPPRPRSGKTAYDSLDDSRAAGGRSSRYDRTRGYDRSWESDRDRDHDKERGRGGSGRSSRVEEPPRDATVSRHGSDRDRDRDRDRERREGQRERDERGGGSRREAPGDGDGGDARARRDGDASGVREAKRERGVDGDRSQPGGGGSRGGRDAEAARYVSAEEREERQRQAEEAAKPTAPKEQPNLGLSGKLAAETKKVAGGIELKHVPPPESRLPDKRWRLYIFKNDQLQDEPYRIHRMDHYLFGRDMHVADIITAHPSCSKQHAVLQFRLTQKDDEFGRPISAVRPYLLDLGSVNGTFLNGERLEALRYYELMEKDVVRLGQSTREYVLLHDKSGDE